MQFNSEINGKEFEIELNEDLTEATVNGNKYPVEVLSKESGRLLVRSGTRLFKIDNIDVNSKNIAFSLNGTYLEAEVKNEQDLLLEKLGFHADASSSSGNVNAPMPGKILELLVAEGDEVTEHEPVLILEAMKMENELKSMVRGVVTKLHVSEGENVEKNQILLDIEASG